MAMIGSGRAGVLRELSAKLIAAPERNAARYIFVGITLLIAADCLTPRYITFGTFYLVLMAYATWTLGRRIGWTIAAIAIAASLAINGFGSAVALAQGHARYIAIGWSLAMRLLSSGAVVELVLSFRRSFDHEKRAGETDGLTGISNRRAFTNALEERIGQIRASGRVGVVAYIDLDGFKPVNDRYGHSAGDEVLVRFAELLATTIRISDLSARIGGDEFAILLDVPEVASAQRAALGLQRRLDEGLETMPYQGLSCSIGAVIVTDTAGGSADRLLRRADELMFEAKAGGFMRIELLDRVPREPMRSMVSARLKSVS